MALLKGINLPEAKRRNINLIKKVIYQYSPISRAEIASMLSLTSATITNNVTTLINDGLVREIETETTEPNNVGRKPIMIEIVPDYNYVVGVEISPKGVFMAACDLTGKVLHKQRVEMQDDEYFHSINFLCESVEKFISGSRISKNKLLGVGVGIPGVIDHTTGEFKSRAWAVWKNHDIEKDLSQHLGLPVLVDNNVTARAVAEGLFDRTRPGTFAYLFVSRGIACPLMIQSSILSRKVAGAGELGHMSIETDGPLCPRCGDYGCLDLYAAEIGIIEKSIRAIKEGRSSMLAQIENPEEITISEVLDAARNGDEAIIEILDSAVKYLAIGICNIIKFICPELVVVDAYIMSLETLKDKFLDYVDVHLSQNSWGSVEFVFKPYDAYGGAVSAAGNAINHFVLDT